MQICIEDNSLIYIYLKSEDYHMSIGKSISDVTCGLLYDDNDNLIGLKLLNTRENTDISVNGIPLIEKINLPKVGNVDTPLYNSAITEDENNITIMFDENVIVHHVREDKCNIDLCKEGIFGIELILLSSIGNREVITPFIVSDVPLTLTELE